MMSRMLTSASQPAQFPGDVPVQLLAPPVAIGPGTVSAGQCRAGAGDVVAQYLLDPLPLRRRLLEQRQGGVEDRHQVATGEAPEREELNRDLSPRRLVVGRQGLGPSLERVP